MLSVSGLLFSKLKKAKQFRVQSTERLTSWVTECRVSPKGALPEPEKTDPLKANYRVSTKTGQDLGPGHTIMQVSP
jgi:hypothetical protein